MDLPKMSGIDRSAWMTGVRIAAIYVLLGAPWIAVSDRLLVRLVGPSPQLTYLQTYKGWLFVAVTGAMLAWLVARQMHRLHRERAQVQRLNHIHRLLSGINSAIVRVRSCDELQKTACQLAVEVGGFALARIALHAGIDGSLRVTNCYGLVESGPLHSQAPLVEVFPARVDRPERVIRWRGDALPMKLLGTVVAPLGMRAIAAFPIPARTDGLAERGWLELFSNTGAAFDQDEILLLHEIARDIGLGLAMIETSEQMDTLTHYDALTGLPNEALLADRLRQSLARAQFDQRVVGVIVAEIPDLTRLEDIRGQEIGDRCTKAVADFLVGAVRDGDTVTRTGRHQFTLVLSDMAKSSDIVELSKQLLSGFQLALDASHHTVRLALRGGAALYPDDADNADDLLRYAALALHSRPAAPGHCTFYSLTLDALAQERLRLEHGLNHALERNELSLVYQLLVDTRTQQPVGGEALLRWHNETSGDIGPARFIPIAEESGAIHAIGDWVLEQTCLQLRTWCETATTPFQVSVNVAPPQLLREGFVESVRSIAERTGVMQHLGSLALEVTEGALLHDLERAETVLRALRKLGIRIYLDDFGTGYSSLSYLNRLPVDVLKIDRSFIREVPANRRSGALVKSIIALAHSLGIKVVAEGVESQAQLRFLSYLDCDLLQGDLFSRPGPAEHLSVHFAASG